MFLARLEQFAPLPQREAGAQINLSQASPVGQSQGAGLSGCDQDVPESQTGQTDRAPGAGNSSNAPGHSALPLLSAWALRTWQRRTVCSRGNQRICWFVRWPLLLHSLKIQLRRGGCDGSATRLRATELVHSTPPPGPPSFVPSSCWKIPLPVMAPRQWCSCALNNSSVEAREESIDDMVVW